MNRESVLSAYARLAPVYDFAFGRSLESGRRLAVSLANKAPGRVLELGVGTGISLQGYRCDHEVTGIDISANMLEKARARVSDLKLSHVKELLLMDAAELAFPDNSFDIVVAMYVMTVVPNPKRVLREIERVCAPGGRVLIVNHFAKENGLRGRVERHLTPFSSLLGWRTDFRLETILTRTSLNLMGIEQVGFFGLFTLLQLCKGRSGWKPKNRSQTDGTEDTDCWD